MGPSVEGRFTTMLKQFVWRLGGYRRRYSKDPRTIDSKEVSFCSGRTCGHIKRPITSGFGQCPRPVCSSRLGATPAHPFSFERTRSVVGYVAFFFKPPSRIAHQITGTPWRVKSDWAQDQTSPASGMLRRAIFKSSTVRNKMRGPRRPGSAGRQPVRLVRLFP